MCKLENQNAHILSCNTKAGFILKLIPRYFSILFQYVSISMITNEQAHVTSLHL